MRQITLVLAIGAFLLAGCDAGSSKARQAESGNTIRTQEVTTLDSNGNLITRDEVVYEGDPLYSDDNRMQAEEADPRSEDRKTFHEKQWSDDASDYPVDPSNKGETFNEAQKNP